MLSMTTLKLIEVILLWLTVISIWVVALWIFPRLFVAPSSPAISQSIRRHPFLHLLWGLAGIAAVYLFIKNMIPVIAY